MAGLVARIKSKARRRSNSTASGLSISGKQEFPDDTNVQYGVQSQQSPPIGPTRLSVENSAFHVTRGYSSPSKRSSRVKNDSGSDQGSSIHRLSSSSGCDSHTRVGGVQNRRSSPGLHKNTILEQEKPGQPVVDDLVPERRASLHVLGRYDEPISSDTYKNYDSFAEGYIPRHSSSSSDQSKVVQRTPQHVAQNTFPTHAEPHKSLAYINGGNSSNSSLDPSNDDSDHIVSLDKAAATLSLEEKGNVEHIEMAHEHLRLPEGFDLSNTETTHVTEEYRPAVTHEKIIKDRTEIVQEAITRDIHVHHYYTYLQPVKVVEILPAKHYVLDPGTGLKTEIPAPEGWQLPSSMSPTMPDTSPVKGWTRHYLVNEKYPNGILEEP